MKKFLNRIAGLDVARQNLIFSLFMATLDDVVTDAKATGEFEGSVEDIRASRVTLKGAPIVIANDTSCGAKTELTNLVIDRGISFNSIVQTVIDEDTLTDSKEPKDDVINTKASEKHCKSGFYLSKRKIAGRFLVMFAQRKVEREIDENFIDPLHLMIISRPNTGKNPCEMTSQDVHYKYKLLLSSRDLLSYLRSVNGEVLSDVSGEEKSDKEMFQPNATDIIRSRWGRTVADLWDDAYANSNFRDHSNGLAPRISEVGLITGAVLHVLPSLEKAVQFLPQNQRSLRVMRVELSDSPGQRIVGIKFPVTEEAVGRLMSGMKDVVNARQGSLGAPSYVDEPFFPIDEKAKTWATAERKTMKSFFGATASSTSGKSSAIAVGGVKRSGVRSKPGKQMESPFLSHPLDNTSEKKTQKSKQLPRHRGPAKKKVKTASISISSFFGSKKNY